VSSLDRSLSPGDLDHPMCRVMKLVTVEPLLRQRHTCVHSFECAGASLVEGCVRQILGGVNCWLQRSAVGSFPAAPRRLSLRACYNLFRSLPGG
jgi:hypothetical protein